MKTLVRSFVMATGLAMALGATTANAATLIATLDGNDCAGLFGANFNECAIPSQYDADMSPVIAKFDFNDNGAVTQTSLNTTLFPSLDGTEWSFDGPAMTWTYNPGPGDPTITFFVAKGGNAFNLFLADDELSDNWFTPNNPSGGPAGLSHLTFYDTDGDTPPDTVPEPVSVALLGLGLLGAAIAHRRRR
jgi:hypothetical protein